METDLQILRALCDESKPREERRELLNFCSHHAFLEPEHEVVYESIRALFPRGAITAAGLTEHLTRRGFPDTNVEKYTAGA